MTASGGGLSGSQFSHTEKVSISKRPRKKRGIEIAPMAKTCEE